MKKAWRGKQRRSEQEVLYQNEDDPGTSVPQGPKLKKEEMFCIGG